MRQYLREMAEPRSSEPVVLLNEVFPGDTNALDTLFGGRLMSIMTQPLEWRLANSLTMNL